MDTTKKSDGFGTVDALVQSKSPAGIQGMFHDIAPSYDFLNRLLSFGIDQSWRRVTVRETMRYHPEKLLDVCCGTGDLAVEFQKQAKKRGVPLRIIGSDFTARMMVRGHKKLGLTSSAPPPQGPASLVGDTVQLPFPSEYFDAVTVAFGIRNVADTKAGLIEMARVCKTGGHIAVLEFSHPRLPGVRQGYELYFHHVLPRVGALLTGTKAYKYLPNSVAGFPDTPEFCRLMEQTVGPLVLVKRLTFGIATLYIARKQNQS
jgi:demethylmenaquinone methyltransferase/2-methoxy-6-polyprenyl-1,4-benzoquinol methylase